MMVKNLDAACAELGAKLGASGNKDTENSITKALGVLEEQGIYALFLYLVAREGSIFVSDLIDFMDEWCEARTVKQCYERWSEARGELEEAKEKAKARRQQHEKEAKKAEEAAKEVENHSRQEFFQALYGYAKNVEKLLFARDLLHRALVYARYHAKAAQIGGDGT